MKTFKLYLAVLLTTLWVMVPVYAEIENETPPTTTIDGTTYYELSDVDDMFWFAEQVFGDNYCIRVVLTNDIDMEKRNWEPLDHAGSSSGEMGFRGVLDGQNHKLYNFCSIHEINGSTYSALVKRLNQGCIKNLTIENAVIEGYVAAGFVNSAHESTIENCTFNGTVSGNSQVAGICSQLDSCRMQYCRNLGKIKGVDRVEYGTKADGSYGVVARYKPNETAGLCAALFSSSIYDCYNLGNVSGYSNVGGLFAGASRGRIEDCYSSGIIEGNSAGGLCGALGSTMNKGGTMTNCYFNSDLYSGSTYASNQYGYENACYGVSEEKFKNGFVAYKMNFGYRDWYYEQYYEIYEKENKVWGQKLGVDPYPIFSEDIVYTSLPCKSHFSNTDGAVKAHVNAEANCLTYRICEDCGKGFYNTDKHISDELVYGLDEDDSSKHVLMHKCCLGVSETANHTYQDGECTVCHIAEGVPQVGGVYQVSTAGELMRLARMINDGKRSISVKLCKDIDLSGYAWDPIGTCLVHEYGPYLRPFKGTFDGDGHTVSNMYVYERLNYASGFFGGIESATVKNLGIIEADVTLRHDVGVGFLCGQMTSSTISDCYALGKITTYSDYAGGIAGQTSGGTIQNCFTDYTAINTDSGTTIQNCFFKGEGGITEEEFASGSVAYSLNNGRTPSVWKQTLGTQAYPGFNGQNVYYDEASDTYYNLSRLNLTKSMVKASDFPAGSVLSVASYKNNRLTGVKTLTLGAEDYSSELSALGLSVAGADCLKAFVWSGTDNLTPLCAAEVISLLPIVTHTPNADGTLTIQLENVPNGSRVILAAYQNQTLTDILTKTYSGEALTFEAMTGSYTGRKLMILNPDTLSPVCAAIVVES